MEPDTDFSTFDLGESIGIGRYPCFGSGFAWIRICFCLISRAQTFPSLIWVSQLEWKISVFWIRICMDPHLFLPDISGTDFSTFDLGESIGIGRYPCFGSGLAWIRIFFATWIRIRNQNDKIKLFPEQWYLFISCLI